MVIVDTHVAGTLPCDPLVSSAFDAPERVRLVLSRR